MRSNVVSLVQPEINISDALAVLDDLRAAVEAGRIKAFACVGIAPDQGTLTWQAATQPTKRLEMIGAMAHMLHCYQDE